MVAKEDKIIGEAFIKQPQSRKITDFDSGLLQESFEHITGTPQEKYDKWCEHLVNVASRLENLHLKDNKRLEILDNIDTFFKKGLPQIYSTHTEFEKKALYHEISRADGKTSGCTTDIYNDIVRSIREEQYTTLANEAMTLVYKAKARLNSDSFKWHRSNITKR